MKISEEMVKNAFSKAKKVYLYKTDKKTAVNELKNELGMNEGSASDYINDYAHMRKGEAYTRTMNEFAVRYYLSNIYKDEGVDALRLAIHAVTKHLEYYENLENGKLPGQRKILKEMKDLLINEEKEGLYTTEEIEYFEGKVQSIYVNSYERNVQARKECIKYYGYKCAVCELCMEDKYGALGKEYTHIHHLKELSTIGKEYIVDPINDLRPLCPNCHAMIHKKRPAYTIPELRELIKR